MLSGTTAAPISQRWNLRLLGGFELSDGAQRHGKLGTRAAIALLARLCLQPGNTQPRELLVELLWPGVEPDAGRQRLRQTLSSLRQVLEPPQRPGFKVLDADRAGIRVLPGTVQCDAAEFERAFKAGDHDQARALYAGELLPGHYDEWISDERLRLEGLFDRLRAPTPPAAPAATAAALPAPARPAPRADPQRSALPAYLTRLIGADTQATRLKVEVASHRLVTLLGPGGTGKTRLAVEAAQALATVPAWPEPGDPAAGAERAFDIVAFVPLAACTTEQQLLDQVLLSLRLAGGKAGALSAIVQALDGRRALLVLDNFEQLVDAGAEAVAALGARLPLLHQLVTSRRALALAGEREVVVAALGLPALDAALAEAALSPAVAMFVDRARAARAEFHLHEGNRAAVIELVHLLDGMPLAIELAAARVRSLAPAEMAATLRRAREGSASALDLLARPPVRGRSDTRHHSMQETIDWSWQLLAPEQRALLGGLTVFHGSFSAAAAQAVCSEHAHTAHQVPLRLDELLSHSLLRAVPADDDADALRFSLYEPIREFAQRALSADDAAALRRRHRDWAIAWGRAMPATPPLAAVRTEMPNLVAAMSSAMRDGQPRAAIEIALALRPALVDVDLPGAGVATLEAATAVCDDLALKSSGMILLGRALFRSGRGNDGRRLIEQGIVSAPTDQPAIRARGLVTAATVAWNSGDRSEQLLTRLVEAQALAQAAGDAGILASANGMMGEVVGHRDRDFARGDALHGQALAVWQLHGDRVNEMRTRFSLAQLAFTARRHREACEQVGPVIDDARRMQSWHMAALCLTLRGAANVEMRCWSAACADSLESLSVAWLALDSWNAALAIWNLLHPLARTGRPALAQQLAGFIGTFWVQRFSPLFGSHEQALRRVRRLAKVQVGAQASAAAFAAGQQLSLAEAVALAQAAAAA